MPAAARALSHDPTPAFAIAIYASVNACSNGSPFQIFRSSLIATATTCRPSLSPCVRITSYTSSNTVNADAAYPSASVRMPTRARSSRNARFRRSSIWFARIIARATPNSPDVNSAGEIGVGWAL